MAKGLKNPTALVKDLSSILVSVLDDPQQPVTPAPGNLMPLGSMGTCISMYHT